MTSWVEEQHPNGMNINPSIIAIFQILFLHNLVHDECQILCMVKSQ